MNTRTGVQALRDLAVGLRKRDTMRASPGLIAHLSITKRRAQSQSLGGRNKVGDGRGTYQRLEHRGHSPLHRSAHSVATTSLFYSSFIRFVLQWWLGIPHGPGKSITWARQELHPCLSPQQTLPYHTRQARAAPLCVFPADFEFS